MAKRSAGLLMFRRKKGELEVFLAHPGGPFWVKKDDGAWTIPKGEHNPGEAALEAARREFHEETGFTADGPFLELGSITQAGGKVVTAWACEGDCDPAKLVSNACEIEWPPRSGRSLSIPEVDRGAWFDLEEAAQKIKSTQKPLLERLREAISEAQ